MLVHSTKYSNGVHADLLWPARPGERFAPTHEIDEADLRLLLRWKVFCGPDTLRSGQQLALFRRTDLDPMLAEIGG